MARAKRYDDGPIHKQVELTVNGNVITCDKGVVKLIKSLDKAGAKTRYSCQGSWGYDIPYVAVERMNDIDKVRSVVKKFWKRCIIFESNEALDGMTCYYALKSRFQINHADRFLPSMKQSCHVIAGNELLSKEAL